MRPIRFRRANRVLAAPAGMDNCDSLPIFGDGEHCISCWRPSRRERLAIFFGRPVWLWVVSGRTQPPVCVDIRNPWKPVRPAPRGFVAAASCPSISTTEPLPFAPPVGDGRGVPGGGT